MFPNCTLDFSGSHELTIDHKFPQAAAKEAGWSYEEIWHLDNLQLMGKSCNARKGNIIPNEDGTLTLKSRPQRVDKTLRSEPCNLCESGRLLLEDEECELCGSGPQPATAPKYLQVEPKECDHSTFHCWMCFTGMVPRKRAIDRIIEGP